MRKLITAALLAPAACCAQAEQALPEVKVRGVAERADGPVQGYRARRSSSFTKTDTPLEEVPASVSVVPSQVMKDQAMRGMGDVFRYVPGVLLHQGEGNRDQLVIRGTSTTADFYVDGVRDDAQVFRDLYNLERVEVLKGPAGMAFGRGGAGGVVNRVTRKPAFERIAEGAFTLGNWAQRRAAVDLGNRLGETAAWRLNAMYETANSFRRGADMERYAANPTATWLAGERTALTVGYEYLRDYRTADRGFPSAGGQPFQAEPGRFFGNAEQSRAKSEVDAIYAVVEHELGRGMQLRNTTRATHYDKHYQNVFAGSAVNTAGNLTLSAYNNANERTNLFNQTDVTKKIDNHQLLAGVELGRQVSESRRNTGFFGAATSTTVSAEDPFAVATSFRPNGTDADNRVTANVAALYLQDQVTLSPRWKAIGGLRYDRFGVDLDDRRTTTPPMDLSRTDSAFSPRLGLIWSPAFGGTYYAAYSFAFLPSGEQLGLATTTADLSPEKARNYELGGRWNLRPALQLSAAVFRTDRTDVRVADPAHPGLFTKTGETRTDGLEIGLQGDVAPGWQVYGGYAHLDGRVESPISTGTNATPGSVLPAGRKLALVPADTLSLWNRVRVSERWSAGLGVIHQSTSYASVSNNVRLPAFSRLDGALFYEMAKNASLALNLENVFDKDYFPTADNDNNLSPGAPRNLRVTLRVGF